MLKISNKLFPAALAVIMTMTAFTDYSQATENGSASDVSDSNSDWSYSQFAMGGGGFVSGVFATPEEGLYYARTDVGGAYRWDKDEGKWKSLSYNITEDDKGLYGIEGLAFAADEPKRLYLLAGTEYFSNGKTCVMISDDYGETFETVDISDYVRVHGNGYGRQNGERIAVDPINHDIVYIGGRFGGLIKSTDGGRTWTVVKSLSDATSLSDVTDANTPNKNGICSIAIDRASSNGSECTRIYIAVSKNNEENVWVSNDSGESWSAVPDLPKELYPQRMRFDGRGNLLITYGEFVGPGDINNSGGIWRLNIASGAVEDISPIKCSIGDVAVDPTNPDRMVAVTENHWNYQGSVSWGDETIPTYGDEFFRTTDGGRTWESIKDKMIKTDGGLPWTVKYYSMHWCGCLMIDPYDPNKIKVISGNGIFGCENIWDDAPEFHFDAKGIEETVPFELVTIPNGPIVTAIGDYDGFINDSPFEYGRHQNSGAGTVTSLAVAYENPNVWVKCSRKSFYYTLDSGDNWSKANVEDKVGNGDACVSVSADGKRFFWAAEKAWDSEIEIDMYYSDDKGDTWNICKGIQSAKYVVCDPVNPNYVYATNRNAFYVSSDGGKSFEKTFDLCSAVRITVVPGREGVVYLPAMQGEPWNAAASLQVSADHGMTFTKNESLAVCRGVGVGKGKDNSCDAIYIWGKPTEDDIIGIYWSTDGGTTWSPVTQGTMQFGGLNFFLNGDVNVYGRCYMSAGGGLGVIVCDLKDKSNHIHEFSEDWKTDDTNHWKECECGEKTEEAASTEEKLMEDLGGEEILSQEEMKKLLQEFEEIMKELEESGGLDLEELMPISSEEMDPEDLELLKKKHRAKEMKEIMEADMKYLKAMFNKLERERQEGLDSIKSDFGANGSSGGQSNGVSLELGGVVAAQGAQPLTQITVMTEGGSIDISL